MLSQIIDRTSLKFLRRQSMWYVTGRGRQEVHWVSVCRNTVIVGKREKSEGLDGARSFSLLKEMGRSR